MLDSGTSVPVPAKVFIKGHDADSSEVYADTLTGSFIRLISAGSWPLTFSAAGYRDTTITVMVDAGQKTDVILYMQKGSNPSDSLLPEPPALYPNPASSLIKALLPEEVSGNVNIMIINQTGRIMIYYDTECFKDVPLQIDISRLSSGAYTALFTNTKKKTSCRGRFIVIK